MVCIVGGSGFIGTCLSQRLKKISQQFNVGGARNLCTVAHEKNIRTIVFTSTVAVYGFAPIGTDESGKIAPFNDYGRTK